MSVRKQRLELTWIGKGERPRLEPRILLEDADKSYHAKALVTDHDIFDNILIHGDNLLALTHQFRDDFARTRGAKFGRCATENRALSHALNLNVVECRSRRQ